MPGLFPSKNNVLPRLTGVAVALLAVASSAAANEFNGRISGTIDGRLFEVALVCSELPGDGWFQVVSDPNHMSSATDGDGDGIAIVVNGNVPMGTTNFNASLDEDKYNFGGKGAELTDHGLRFESTIYRMDKETRKMVPEYEVELEIDCSGPPTSADDA